MLIIFSAACGSDAQGSAVGQATPAQLHHWQAIRSIENGDFDDALHHVEHLVGLVEGDDREALADITLDLREGRPHTAHHELEGMLIGYVGPDLSEDQVHLQIALFSLDADDPSDAAHHVAHFLAAYPGRELADAEAAILQLIESDQTNTEILIRALVAEIVDADLSGQTCRSTADREGFGEDIRAVVVFDREWATFRQDRAVADALALVEQVNGALHEIGHHLEVVDYIEWDRPTDLSFDNVGPRAVQDLSLDPEEELVIVLTGGHPNGGTDGTYRRTSNSIAVKHNHNDHAAEPNILTHEIGHAVGLAHRSGTYMQPHGSPLVPVWSECQKADH